MLFEPTATIEAIRQAGGLADRWRAFSGALASLGFDKVNYTAIEGRAGESNDVDTAICSTLPLEWLAYYVDNDLEAIDPLVAYVRSGARQPLMFDSIALARTDEVARVALDGEMRSGVLTVLDGVAGGPPGAFVLGSSLGAAETHRIARDHAGSLLALTSAFQAAAGPQALMARHQLEPLSLRERDCLQAVARGRRIGVIAHDLVLAEVTVGLHLRNARRKLGAASLPEAVARGLMFGQIEAW